MPAQVQHEYKLSNQMFLFISHSHCKYFICQHKIGILSVIQNLFGVWPKVKIKVDFEFALATAPFNADPHSYSLSIASLVFFSFFFLPL
jgi:hypothetical protein